MKTNYAKTLRFELVFLIVLSFMLLSNTLKVEEKFNNLPKNISKMELNGNTLLWSVSKIDTGGYIGYNTLQGEQISYIVHMGEYTKMIAEFNDKKTIEFLQYKYGNDVPPSLVQFNFDLAQKIENHGRDSTLISLNILNVLIDENRKIQYYDLELHFRNDLDTLSKEHKAKKEEMSRVVEEYILKNRYVEIGKLENEIDKPLFIHYFAVLRFDL